VRRRLDMRRRRSCVEIIILIFFLNMLKTFVRHVFFLSLKICIRILSSLPRRRKRGVSMRYEIYDIYQLWRTIIYTSKTFVRHMFFSLTLSHNIYTIRIYFTLSDMFFSLTLSQNIYTIRIYFTLSDMFFFLSLKTCTYTFFTSKKKKLTTNYNTHSYEYHKGIIIYKEYS